MPAGGKRPGAGRKKGIPNKVTAEARAIFKALLEKKAPEIEQMIEDTWRGIEIEKQMPNGETVVGRLNADPGKAAALMLQLAEFSIPKLQRTEKTIADATDEELLAEIRRRKEAATQGAA